MILKRGKAQAYQSYNNRTSRAYRGLFYTLEFKILPCVRGNKLCGLGNLEYIVKAELDKPVKDIVDVIKIVKLTVKGGGRKSNLPFEALHCG